MGTEIRKPDLPLRNESAMPTALFRRPGILCSSSSSRDNVFKPVRSERGE
jgi:hypothetical protein